MQRSNTLISVGKESEYTKDELKPLKVTTDCRRNVTQFPEVDYGWHVACAYNQFDMDGMANMYICKTLEDMNELVRNSNNGGALKISWHTIPDTHFATTLSVHEFKKSSEGNSQTQTSSALFQAKSPQASSMDMKSDNSRFNQGPK